MNVTLLLPSGETIKPDFEFVNSKEIKLKIENLNLKNGVIHFLWKILEIKKPLKKVF